MEASAEEAQLSAGSSSLESGGEDVSIQSIYITPNQYKELFFQAGDKHGHTYPLHNILDKHLRAFDDYLARKDTTLDKS